MRVERLAIIGCGLMGGSFALALRSLDLVGTVAGYSASANTRATALALGVIDEACESVAQAVTGADVVLLAVPVQATEVSLRAMAPHLGAQTLLMDVGSTKCDVVAAARATLGSALSRFVPAHPIAGKEMAGVAHAEAALYQARPSDSHPAGGDRFCARRAGASALGGGGESGLPAQPRSARRRLCRGESFAPFGGFRAGQCRGASA